MCRGLSLHKRLQPLWGKPCLFFHILDLLMSELPCFVACGMTEIPREMWWFMHRAYIYRAHNWIHWVLTAVEEGYLHCKSLWRNIKIWIYTKGQSCKWTTLCFQARNVYSTLQFFYDIFKVKWKLGMFILLNAIISLCVSGLFPNK